MNFASLLDSALDLLYPRHCLLCVGRIQDHPFLRVCERCLEALAWRDTDLCECCGKPRMETQACHDCHGRAFAFDGVLSFGPYSGDLRRLLHDFKFNRKKSTGRDIARCMAHSESIRRAIGRSDALIAVPLHPLRQKERGFNQSAVLAETLGLVLGGTYMPGILVKGQPTAPQTQLGRDERWDSAKGAFAVSADPMPMLRQYARTVLVDDVLTTGATAHACARLLKEVGVPRVSVVVVARSVGGIMSGDDEKMLA